MRCPKCQYITFDSGDKCRNCGYEFSLATEPPDLDLPIQTGDEPEGPFSVPDPVAPRPITESFDLPLFSGRSQPVDDRPLVNARAVPRTPLSVRKQAPVIHRAPRRHVDEGDPHLDLEFSDDLDDDVDHVDDVDDHAHAGITTSAAAQRHVEPSGVATTASAPARIFAGAIDLLVLGGIDAAVLHLTLKICQLQYSDIRALPIAPFASFLLILNGGYFTAFTAAGGQSIGKMAARIKVIPSDREGWSDRVPLGQAVLRAASYLVSALPAGLGFLPAVVGSDKRALHDRLAHTRVVKA
jgi:uncharacterized RDD family membrane protein YckC